MKMSLSTPINHGSCCDNKLYLHNAYTLRLLEILKVMVIKQVLNTTNQFIAFVSFQRWIDEYLRWNPDDYGGIKQTVVPWNRVWTPDIVIVNT